MMNEVEMVLEEGQWLDGKYVILRVLATGSMGEVYLGRNERIGKEVAVKVLRRDCADDRAIVNRFEQEARIATAVKSSHVVDVYDLGELPSGERFIVMEYVDGESLGTRMAREGRLSARAVGAITLQILDGLVAAHDAGVIHRDLKPDNVILTQRDGQELVKLVDFGVSKRSDGGARAPRDMKRATLDGMLLGTPMFMSPEQARGELDGVDHRTDIFSLGVSMYEALSGDVPFNGDNVVSLLSRIMDQPEVPLEERVPKVDPGLARIVKKAMAKDPSQRYQTAAEMREAVAAWYAVFGSTSATRSSLEGVARAPLPSPSPSTSITPTTSSAFSSDDATLAFRGLSFTFNRKRARASIAAAAIAAAVTSLLMRHPAQPAPDAVSSPTTTAAATTAIATTTATAVVPTTAAMPLVTTPPREPSADLVAAPASPSAKPALAASATPKKSAPLAAPEATPARLTRSTPARPRSTTPKPDDPVTDAGAARDARAIAVAPKIEEPTTPVASASETPPPDPPATP